MIWGDIFRYPCALYNAWNFFNETHKIGLLPTRAEHYIYPFVQSWKFWPLIGIWGTDNGFKQRESVVEGVLDRWNRGKPKNKGTKHTGVLSGLYATCVGVYCDTWKIELLKPNLTKELQRGAETWGRDGEKERRAVRESEM